MVWSEDFFEFDGSSIEEKRVFLTLIIYDVKDNKKRNKLAKFLLKYGYRVQKSAIECRINNKVYRTLLEGIERFIDDEDLIRIYKLTGNSDIRMWGTVGETEYEDVVIV